MAVVRHKEAIHSGHFMISNFEAEAEDEEDMAVPPPEEGSNLSALPMDNQMVRAAAADEAAESIQPEVELPEEKEGEKEIKMGCIRGGHEAVIDLSLNKLFRSMSIAYRQKLTSPKWNRFRGLRLRWKDKIRLNNVIWRCWHMQFIKGRNKLLCAFANPLEIDNHNRTEGSTLLEGKYWKRKMNTVTQQYMKWRLFYKNRGSSTPDEDLHETPQWDVIFQDNWQPTQSLGVSKDDVELHMLGDHEDFLLEALFSTFNAGDATNGGKNQNGSVAGIQFPNPREIQKSTTNADFIQPGLVQLQPSLDEIFMDIEPQPDWLLSKLPTIVESADETAIDSNSGNNFVGQRHVPVPSKGKTVPAVASATAEIEPSGAYSGAQQGDSQIQQQIQPPEESQGVVSGGSYPLDLQMPQNAADILPRSPTTSSNFLQEPQQHPMRIGQQQQQQQDQQQPRTSQATVMDLASAAVAIQQQQNQLQHQQLQQQLRQQQQFGEMQPDTSLYPNYGEAANKKQFLSNSSAKRHSPKHRILHHRQYSSPSSTPSNSNLETAENLSVQYSPSGRVLPPSAASSTTLGMTPPSPYRSPTHNNAQSSPTPSSLLEPRSRVMSGGDTLATQNTSLAGHKRPAVINADSELVQLLRTTKYSKMEEQHHLQQQQQQQQLKQQFVNGLSPSLAPKIKVDVDERLQLSEQLRARNINNTLDLNALKGFNPASQIATNHVMDQALLPGQVKVEYPSNSELHPGLINQQAFLTRPRPGELPKRQQSMVKTLIVPITRPVPPVPARDQVLATPKGGGVQQSSQRVLQPSLKDQKRRGGGVSGSKNGFDLLRSLIPSLNHQNSSVKISKAALLHKGGDYLQQLTTEKAQLAEEIASHRGKIEALNAAIGDLHKTMAAATSSGGSRARSGFASDTYNELEQLFDDHVVRCSHQNWKYWPFSLMLHPLLRSFQSTVDASSYDELQRTCANWLDQHMSLAQLRPTSITALTELSRRTELVERSSAEGLAERALVEALRSRRARYAGSPGHSSPGSSFTE